MTEPVPVSPQPQPQPQPAPRPKVNFKFVRDVTLFVVGVGGILYEVLANGGQNSTLLVMFSGMAGLPAFLFGDARRTQAAPPDAQSPPPQETPAP